ncbi:MAG: DUF222 domain-containing protein, partial [Acidimicrobiales bacterium]
MTTGTLMSLKDRLRDTAAIWARSQFELVNLAAEFADSGEWLIDGAASAAAWLSAEADIEPSTAREWIRIGRCLRSLPASADAFEQGELSYSKIRTLTRVATAANEVELVELAKTVPASDLGRAIAEWLLRHGEPEAIEKYQHRRRGVSCRVEPDGMMAFTLRLPPLEGGTFRAALTARVMRSTPRKHDGVWPTLSQQYADAFVELLTSGAGTPSYEIVLHVRGDGSAMDDGIPIPVSVLERIAPEAFLRALIHDADGRPINASGKQRYPTERQKRVVIERDRACVDCGSTQLLTFDHCPEFAA